MRMRRSARSVGVLVALGGLVASGVLVSPAHAAPDLEQVRMKVMDLESKAESATERFNESRNELQEVRRQLDALKAKVKRERREMREILGAVDDLARAAYTSGGLDTSLQVLLSEDPNEFLAQAAALDAVQRGQASALRKTATARLRLAQSEAAVLDKEARAKDLRDRMKEAKGGGEGPALPKPSAFWRTWRRRSVSASRNWRARAGSRPRRSSSGRPTQQLRRVLERRRWIHRQWSSSESRVLRALASR